MQCSRPALFLTALLGLTAMPLLGAETTNAQLVPIPLRLPLPTLAHGGMPPAFLIEIPADFRPHHPMEEGPNPDGRPRPPFLAPKGVTNVAFGKPVTCSSRTIGRGELKQITDGKKEVWDDQVVEFKSGTQWVQIDLGQEYSIYAIAVWHDFRDYYWNIFIDVIVQVSDDPQFEKNVHTLFNNDYDNSAGKGKGADKEYFETFEGKLIPANSVKARYVRSYTKDKHQIGFNTYQEIEVYGLAVTNLLRVVPNQR